MRGGERGEERREGTRDSTAVDGGVNVEGEST